LFLDRVSAKKVTTWRVHYAARTGRVPRSDALPAEFLKPLFFFRPWWAGSATAGSPRGYALDRTRAEPRDQCHSEKDGDGTGEYAAAKIQGRYAV